MSGKTMGPKSTRDHVVISVLTSAHSKLLVASLRDQ